MTHSDRLSWLDTTRGIAILAVLVGHACTATWPTFTYFHENTLDIGHAGVVLFFFCSGYIMPISLQATSFVQFWVRRFFRLYPLYWFSIILLLLTGLTTTYDPYAILANATMFQNFLGYYHMLGIYWSLTVEMTFYLLISLAYLFKLPHQPVAFASLLLLVASISDVLFPALGYSRSGGWIASHLSTISLGTLFYHMHYNGLSRKLVFAFVGMSLFVQVLGCLSMPAFLTARLLGYGAFGVLLLYRDSTHLLKLFSWLGVISYSVYLTHIIVLDLLRPTDIQGVILVLLASILVSYGSYQLIERPGIAMGRAIVAAKTSATARGRLRDQP
jgi:peptidoglycan/LPS O-acetylase OafA/YrhL